MQGAFGEQRVVDDLHLMGLDEAATGRAEGALACHRGGVVDAGEERQAHLEPATLAARQGLEDLGAAVLDLFHFCESNHQRPAKTFSQQERQHAGAFAGFRLAAGEHQLRVGVVEVFGQRR
ncbi:hypothetical protein D3C81_1732740 [compost metagenome]